MSELHQLLNNGAFWGFLGVIATAFFSYRGLLLPYMEERKKREYIATNGNGKVSKINVKRVTSFDELKAVVEILQQELARKDDAMRAQDARHERELKAAYSRIDELYTEIDQLKTRLHRAHINDE